MRSSGDTPYLLVGLALGLVVMGEFGQEDRSVRTPGGDDFGLGLPSVGAGFVSNALGLFTAVAGFAAVMAILNLAVVLAESRVRTY